MLQGNPLKPFGADLYIQQYLGVFLNSGFYEGTKINKSQISEPIEEIMLKGMVKLCIVIFYKL